MNVKCVFKNIGKIIFSLFMAIFLYLAATIAGAILSFGSPHVMFYTYVFIAVALLIEIAIVGAQWGLIRKKYFYIPLLIGFGICVAVFLIFTGFQSYIDNIETIDESKSLLRSYTPYGQNTKVVTLDEESELVISDDCPIMDGATALYPVYSAFAKAVYPKDCLVGERKFGSNIEEVQLEDYLKCTTTTTAYRNIVTGKADIIFAALPSEEQELFAKEQGVELVYTPIGKEAFVFFVNSKNPLDNVTVEEIQKIYSGEITDWSELGIGRLGEIKAFQRDKGSGSQSTLEKLMAGKTLMTPIKENVVADMGGIIEQTADYKNFKNAIGYSFRFYSKEMVNNNKIKLLSINGVYPNLENIENGTYPLASYFYAVTRKDADENTLKLLEWIKTEQGQKIIEMTGYTPLNSK